MPNTKEDECSTKNGLVMGGAHLRFYSNISFIGPEGYAIGTFYIIDVKSRLDGINLMEKQNLREIAALAMDQILQNRIESTQLKKDKGRLIDCTAHDLLTPLTSIQLNMDLLSEDKEFMRGAN